MNLPVFISAAALILSLMMLFKSMNERRSVWMLLWVLLSFANLVCLIVNVSNK